MQTKAELLAHSGLHKRLEHTLIMFSHGDISSLTTEILHRPASRAAMAVQRALNGQLSFLMKQASSHMHLIALI